MKFSQKNFENWRFWKMAILKIGHFGILFIRKKNFFCFIPIKISHKLCDGMDGTQFWCFPWFPPNSLLCVIYCYTVYLWRLWDTKRIFIPSFYSVVKLHVFTTLTCYYTGSKILFIVYIYWLMIDEIRASKKN